ncbi:transmembrane protein 181-like isoform X2 [Anneissia japonica]|uniref:transmembrane protein 181-like isoform X2 n=1 Tax=Anneissia japonica TaxID=1529436 RepID=UPI0014256430|nr:transmembrane protein 181-like isoform X2 [Anneissia japonica]
MAKMFSMEASVQMRLYTLTKREFVLVFVAFFAAFGISVLVGIAGPSVQSMDSTNATKLVGHNVNIATGPFTLRSPAYSRFNQQLWLTALFYIQKGKGENIEKKFILSVELQGLEEDSLVDPLNSDAFNHTRTLRCSHEICDELIIFHLGTIEYTSYIVHITLIGLEEFHVQEIAFNWRSFNPSFTQVEIWFRFVFLVMTFIVTCMFAHSLRKFTMRDWSIEQKWMSILLPLILLYNDPIFALTFLVDSVVPLMLDSVFQASFLCTLLLFWLCVYHGIRQSKRKWSTFYIPKIILVGLLWASAISLACWQQYQEKHDPTYDYRVDSGNYLAMKIFFFIFGGIYLLYLLFLVIRAFTELRTLPYMNLRLRFMTILMLFVVAISCSIVLLRFGVRVLQDNYISQLSTYYKNSSEFLTFYGLLNFYLYTMAYVYSPSANAHKDSYFKENPNFAMLNDSEDEIIYGSDSDDNVHASLTGSHRYHDDSDDETFK